MPKYTYRRPYYPYVRNPYQQNPGAGVSGAIETGTKMGEQVAKIIAQRKQDQIANQLAAQYGLYAPRAQWVGGTKPDAGVPLQGTTLADQGGVEGLKMRMLLQQRQQTQQAANTKAQLQQALIDQARGKAKSVWTGRTPSTTTTTTPSGKTAAYKAGAYDYENGTLNGQKTADSMEFIQKDIDGATGKNGTAAALLAAIPQMKIVNGKLTIPPPVDANGKPIEGYKPSYRFNDDGSFSVLDRNGNAASTIQANDLQTALNRFNALKIRNGETPIPNPYLKGSESTSTFTPGSKENPFVLDPNKPNMTFRALPNGSYFKDPKGNIQLKQPPSQQKVTQQPNATTPNVPANQFSIPSEGGTSTNLLPPARNTGGVNIPLRSTVSSDESGGDSQRVSYFDEGGATRQPDQTLPTPQTLGAGAGALVGLNQNPEAQDQGDRNQGDRIIVPGNDSRPIENVSPRNPILEAKSDATLPDTSNIAQVSDDDRDLIKRAILGQNLLT